MGEFQSPPRAYPSARRRIKVSRAVTPAFSVALGCGEKQLAIIFVGAIEYRRYHLAVIYPSGVPPECEDYKL